MFLRSLIVNVRLKICRRFYWFKIYSVFYFIVLIVMFMRRIDEFMSVFIINSSVFSIPFDFLISVRWSYAKHSWERSVAALNYILSVYYSLVVCIVE